MKQKVRGTPLPAPVLTALRTLVAHVGVRRAGEMTNTSGNAIRQAMAGLGVLYGTRLAIEKGLQVAVAVPPTDGAPTAA